MNATEPEKRSLDKFLRWKVDVLKDFLRKRGLKTTGKKSELAALAFGAEHLEVPIKVTPSAETTSKALHYKKLLAPCEGLSLPDPLYDLKNGWLCEDDGIQKWPQVLQVDISQYLLTVHDRDIGKRILSDYKEGKAHSYYDANWLKEVFYHPVNDASQWCFLKSQCTPSDSIGNPDHNVWVMVNKNSGEVNSAYCTCFAGLGSTCNHVAAVLFKVEDAWRRGLTNESCTSRPCKWGNYGSTKKMIGGKKVEDMKLKKPHYRKKGNDDTINPSPRKNFNPTARSGGIGGGTSLNKIVNCMYPSCNTACSFQYVNLPMPQIEHPEADFNVGHEMEVMTSEAVPSPLTSVPVNSCDPEVLFKDMPKYNAGQVASLELETRGQSENASWQAHRIGRITGSVIHSVKTKVATLQNEHCKLNKDTTYLVEKILGEVAYNPNIPALKYGRQMEPEARKAYATRQKKLRHRSLKVEECGLFVHKDHVYVGASPDGLISCKCCGTGVLEIKCPLSIAHENPNDVGMGYLNKTEGGWSLKENHAHYSQVQAEMAVTGTKWCDFVVYTHKGMIIERIAFNENTWMDLLSAAQHFYRHNVAPKLLVKILESNNMITPLNTADNVGSNPLPSTSKEDNTPSTSAATTMSSSTSQKRKRTVKQNKEARPTYCCQSCQKICLYPDQISSNTDNTVQCDMCHLWYHWGCAGYDDDIGDWFCLDCENKLCQM